MNNPEALPEASRLLAEEAVAPVAGIHAVIADRVFRYAGSAGSFAQTVHDTVAGGVYRAIPAGAAAVAQVVAGARAEPDADHAFPRSQALLNAAWGDRLAVDASPLAIDTTLLDASGRPLETASLLQGSATHLVVLIHGLGQTEACWQGSDGLAAALAVEETLLPVLVRYNSGRAPGEVGRELAALIDDLWAMRPETEISFVGFSLGGLVSRAAAGAAAEHRLDSAGSVRHIVTLGTPHNGSYIAKAVTLAEAGLGVAGTTQPLAAFLNRRSAAMKTLAWLDGLDELGPLPGVRHHFAAATVTGDRRHPVGVLVGDLVVRVGSATSPAVAADNVSVVGGRKHLDLLTDEAVREQVLGWLAETGD